MSNLAKGSQKLTNAWAFYDWANSVYPLVISSAIFPLFYGILFKNNHHANTKEIIFCSNLTIQIIIIYKQKIYRLSSVSIRNKKRQYGKVNFVTS